MKKFFAIALAGLLSLTMLAGCGDGDKTDNNTDNNNTTATNHAPVISGVEAEATVMAGTEYDALAGVTATDEEDGDLTNKIVVSCDELTVTNGKVTPTAPNSMGYYITYSVKDSGGREATASTTLIVTEKVEALENVYTADFTTPTVPDANKNEAMHHWELVAGQDAATATLKQGALVVDVADGGENAYDVLLKRGFEGFEAVKYRVVAWVESSAATSIKAKASVDSTSYFEEKDVTLKAGYQKVEIEFSIADAGKAWFEFHLGGANKEGFSLSFIKIDIYKVVGTGADTTLFENAFTTSSDGITGSDHAVISFNDSAKETHVAVSYDDGTDHDWYSKATIALGDNAITKGTQYKLSLTLKATDALQLNVCVEDDQKEWEERAFFQKVEAAAGEEKTVELMLDWHDGGWKSLESGKAVIRLYFGLHNADQNNGTNDIIVKNVKLIQPGQTERKAHDNFMLFGRDSFNKKNTTYPYLCESGSDDEHNPVDGVATAYVEGGKLVYKVYEGGANASNNKLIIGFNGEAWDETQNANVPYKNSIELPADAKYVVTFKIKATAAIKFDLCLHAMNYGGEWDEGVLYRRASWQTPEQGEGAISVGTTETEVSFTTDAVYKESECELILEFGSAALKALTGGVTIEISELKVGVQRLAD